jgi:hypothetical protein
MKKNTQILLGVGVLAVIGYFVYKNNTPAKTTASFQGKCRRGESETIVSDGKGSSLRVCQHGADVPRYEPIGR